MRVVRMSLKTVFSLSIHVPQSLADEVFLRLPGNALGSSAFKAGAEDRSADPLWIVEALYSDMPDNAALNVDLAVLAAAHGHAPYVVHMKTLPAQGWLKDNQQRFAPIMAGRFVIHGRKDRAAVKPPFVGLELEASSAFGTGEHPTTYGCLMALQGLRRLPRRARVLDIGTGSGILAMALAKTHAARVEAGEIDTDSVSLAHENVRQNGLAARVRVHKAAGFCHESIHKKAPYQLIVSNIFARPIVALAPAMRRHIAARGAVVLAGFLVPQENMVRSAYALQGFYLERRLRIGNWVILVLRKKG